MTSDDGKGVFVGPDDGKALANPIGGRMVAKVRDGDIAGAYRVMWITLVLAAFSILALRALVGLASVWR